MIFERASKRLCELDYPVKWVSGHGLVGFKHGRWWPIKLMGKVL